MDIPIYLITGFLESGKTSFIKDTLSDPEFTEGCRTLLVVLEEGIEEYDEAFLKENHIDLVVVEDADDMGEKFFVELHKKYNPQRVMIEYNGVWKLETVFKKKMPKEWALAQIIATVDASAFKVQLNNMRAMMTEQLSEADLIIFNRCDESTERLWIRRNVKLMNRKAQIIYETADGVLDDNIEEELPYDLNAEIIDIEDDDYGIFYMDAIDHPERYEGKTLRYTGMVYKGKQFPEGYFVPGRFAMTCCADDTQFVGFICKSKYAEKLKNRQWVKITATAKVEFHKAYGKESIVLHSKRIENATKPEEELVYFT